MKLFDFSNCLVISISAQRVSCRMESAKKPLFSKTLEDVPVELDAIPNIIRDVLLQVKNKHFKAVKVVLADPFVKSIVMTLSQLPKRQSSRERLVTARVDKEYQINGAEYQLAMQFSSNRSGENIVFVAALKKSVLDEIKQVISGQGKVLRHIGFIYQFLHNRSYRYLTKQLNALVYVHDQYWTLAICDGNKNIQLLRSKWFDSDKVVEQRHTDMIREIALTIRTYKNASSDDKKMHIFYLTNTDKEQGIETYFDNMAGENRVNLKSRLGNDILLREPV